VVHGIKRAATGVFGILVYGFKPGGAVKPWRTNGYIFRHPWLGEVFFFDKVGMQTVFETGPIIPAVLASCSIPAIFPPFVIGEGVFVDGGLADNMPVNLFSEALDEVIAIHVNPMPPHHAKDSLARIIDRAWHLSTRAGILQSAQNVHLFIEPPELGTFGMFDANKLPEIYQYGYDFTQQLLQAKKAEIME
jgi:predicted acylesterase/phospholipase RssA